MFTQRFSMVLLFSLVLFSGAYSPPASAQVVQDFTPIVVPFPNTVTTLARGINDMGEVVGIYVDNNGKQHGFVDSSGFFSALDVPLSADTQAQGINNRGEVVGFFIDASGIHGFFYDGGFTTIDVPFPGVIATFAYGINDGQDIVGSYNDANGSHGFLYHDGSFITIDAGINSIAFEINNRGQIVGTFGFATGFLYENGVISVIRFPLPFTTGTSALGINDHGDIVGRYLSRFPGLAWIVPNGFVYDGSSYTQGPGGILTVIWDINNRGQMVGDYVEYDFVELGIKSPARGFVATLNIP